MCGITGVLSFGDLDEEKEKIRQEAMIFLGLEITQLTQARGSDATGVSTLFSNGHWNGLKMGSPAAEFISNYGNTEKNFNKYIEVWRKYDSPAKVFMSHCRKASVGNSWDNINNHPIVIEDIVGVHNGTLDNHKVIFEKLKCSRNGEVDSEAIFRLLNHFTNECKDPFSKEAIQEVARRLQGTYAVLTFNGNNPFQVAAFRNGRPIDMALLKPLKLLVISSDKKYIDQTLFRYNKQALLYSTDKGFPSLTSSNVDFKIMPDDTMAIFNLLTEVGDKTGIEDLYITEKIPYNNRIWRKTVYQSNSYIGSKEYNQAWKDRNNMKTCMDHSGSTVSARPTNRADAPCRSTNCSNNKTSTSKDRGLVWGRSLNKFIDSSDLPNQIEDTIDMGDVEIDMTSDDVSVIEVVKPTSASGEEAVVHLPVVKEDNDSESLKLKESTEDIVPNVSCAVEIKESKIKDEDKPATEATFSPINPNKVSSYANTVEVDVDVNAKAMEAAETAANRNLNKYENEKDITRDISVLTAKNIQTLPMYVVGNIISKYQYKLGFYEGYNEGSAADDGKNIVKQDDKDVKSIQRNLRVLKTMTITIARILGESDIPIKRRKELIAEHVEKTVEERGELHSDVVNNIYSVGDYKNIPVIKEMADAVKSLEL